MWPVLYKQWQAALLISSAWIAMSQSRRKFESSRRVCQASPEYRPMFSWRTKRLESLTNDHLFNYRIKYLLIHTRAKSETIPPSTWAHCASPPVYTAWVRFRWSDWGKALAHRFLWARPIDTEKICKIKSIKKTKNGKHKRWTKSVWNLIDKFLFDNFRVIYESIPCLQPRTVQPRNSP